MIGRRLAHYEILEKLGEGGMGVVYKARDTHLDRFVALKVLPPEKLTDPGRKARFVQEAKSASALNHPNIITIYDISSDAGFDFMAMEYLPGKTMDQLIGRKGLSLNETLNYAMQIAGALARAHAAGIVHRDLKPTNIMVDEHGLVKVLDFGLAKLAEASVAGEDAPTRTMMEVTEEGTIVGTAAYMSPEQAQGRKVDARSDTFAFGSVLYEMVTGRQAFRGDSKLSTLAAILEREPQPIQGVVPTELDRIIRKCLRKDPDRRYQHMEDVRSVLEDLKEESDSGKLLAVAAPARGRIPRVAWIAAGGVLVLAAAVVVGLLLWRRATEPVPIEFKTERLTTDPGITMMPAVAPDGKMAAFASDRSGEGHLDIWIQHMGSGQARRLTQHPAEDYSPSFLADGSRILFRSERDGGGIYSVEILSGIERRLVAGGMSPVASPTGERFAFVRETRSSIPGSRVYIMLADGREEREVAPGLRVRTVGSIPMLVWSEDGKRLVFEGVRVAERQPVPDWWVVPVDGGEASPLQSASHVARTVPIVGPAGWYGGYLYFFRGSLVEGVHLLRLPLADHPVRIAGPAQRLTSGATSHFYPSFPGKDRLLFDSSTYGQDLTTVTLDADGKTAVGAASRLTTDNTVKGGATLSADGRLLVYAAFVSWERKVVEVRVKELASGKETVYLSGDLPLFVHPVISGDGKRIAYSLAEGGNAAAYVGLLDSPPGNRVCTQCQILGFFSNSGELLIRYGTSRLVRRNLESGNEVELVRSEVNHIAYARLSPDDRWLVLTDSTPGGDSRTWIVPISGRPAPEADWIRVEIETTQQWQLFSPGNAYPSNTRPTGPAWSHDGNTLYFLSDVDGHICVWGQRLDPASKKPQGTPWVVFHQHRPTNFRAWHGRALFVLASRGRLILPSWTGSSNLWLGKLEEKRTKP